MKQWKVSWNSHGERIDSMFAEGGFRGDMAGAEAHSFADSVRDPHPRIQVREVGEWQDEELDPALVQKAEDARAKGRAKFQAEIDT